MHSLTNIVCIHFSALTYQLHLQAKANSPVHRRAQHGTFFILRVFMYTFRAENDAAGRFKKQCAQSACLGPGRQIGVKTANSLEIDGSRLKICIDTFFHMRISMVIFGFGSFENFIFFWPL